jgi:hypothetical protein
MRCPEAGAEAVRALVPRIQPPILPLTAVIPFLSSVTFTLLFASLTEMLPL